MYMSGLQTKMHQKGFLIYTYVHVHAWYRLCGIFYVASNLTLRKTVKLKTTTILLVRIHI